MKTKILGAALGLTILAASTAASAHVDLAIGIGVPGVAYAPEPVYVAPPPPVAYVPAPVVVDYGDDWRAREWRERREDHERHEWREHERHDRGDRDRD